MQSYFIKPINPFKGGQFNIIYTVSTNALSYESPIVPTEAITPQSAILSV